MELLERYLQAISTELPRAQRDDIIAEISAEILAQADDRIIELGRPLTRDEETAILKAYGHPRIVASRYWKTQYLIGPLLLPFYLYTVRVVAIAVAILAFGLATIKGAAHGDIVAEMATAWGVWWGTVLSGVGVTTIIFAVIERTSSTLDPLQRIGVNKWDPRKLAPVSSAARFSPLSSTFELIFNGLFVAWLLDVNRTKDALALFTGPGAHPIAWPFVFAPVWQMLVLPLAAIASLYILTIIAQLARPALLPMRVAGRIVYNLCFTLVAVILAATPTLIIVTGQQDATQALTVVFRTAFAFSALIAAWEVYRDIRFILPKAGSGTLPKPVGIL